jgi:hypothetical protein
MRVIANYLTIHMIHRNIEVPHRLARVQVTGKDTVCPSFCDQIGNQFGCNGFSTLSLQEEK